MRRPARGALETLVHHIHACTTGRRRAVDERPGGDPHRAHRRRIRIVPPTTELVVGVCYRVLQVLLGAQWQRAWCASRTSAADLASPTTGARARRRVRPRVQRHRLQPQPTWTPQSIADPVLALASACSRRRSRAQRRMADRVRQLVVLLLPRGLCRVEVVAQHLGVDRRTVHRKLAAESTSFTAIVDAVRCDPGAALTSRHQAARPTSPRCSASRRRAPSRAGTRRGRHRARRVGARRFAPRLEPAVARCHLSDSPEARQKETDPCLRAADL